MIAHVKSYYKGFPVERKLNRSSLIVVLHYL